MQTMGDVVDSGFFGVVTTSPERIAILDPEGRSVTFGDMGARVNGVSHALRSLGLRKGDVVASLLHNDKEYFELLLATGQIGLYLVPINSRLTPSEVAYITKDSAAKVLVAHADLAARLAEIVAELPPCRFSVGGQADGWIEYQDLDGPATAPEAREAGSIMGYTSGTTGRPKGVQRALTGASPETAARSICGRVRMFGFDHDHGVHLVCSPLYHAAPAAFARGALHLGHTLVCHRGFDAELVLHDIEKHRVTTSHMVPTHFHRLISVPDRDRHNLSSLASIVHAGAPCPVGLKAAMIDWLGPIVWEYLGSTEGVGGTIVSSAEWLAKPGTVGKPMPGITIKILDAAGLEVPAGEEGTIYSGSAVDSTSFVYHNDVGKTAASRSGNLATVGDIGRFDEDGYLFVLDRRDDIIISGGVNIYPAEIESQLTAHPAVKDVAVIGIPDPEWGQSVLAIVQLEDAFSASDELTKALLAHSAAGLASYKRPRRIEFRADFPRTPTGKLQRRVLKESYMAAVSTKER